MKSFLLIFLFLVSSAAYAQDELQAIENLIAKTQAQLQLQTDLKNQMILFQKMEDLFVKGEESATHISKMITAANKILSLIKENHLQYLFSSEYLEELALFSSIGAKNSPSRP